MAKNIGPGHVRWECIIVPVLVEPLPQHRHVDGEKKGLISSFCNILLTLANEI